MSFISSMIFLGSTFRLAFAPRQDGAIALSLISISLFAFAADYLPLTLIGGGS